MRGRIELPFLGLHSLKQKRGGERAFLSLLENILEVAQLDFLPSWRESIVSQATSLRRRLGTPIVLSSHVLH